MALEKRPCAAGCRYRILTQLLGMTVAFGGLGLIGLTIGGTMTVLGFMLTLASAISWATGNVLVERLPRVAC